MKASTPLWLRFGAFVGRLRCRRVGFALGVAGLDGDGWREHGVGPRFGPSAGDARIGVGDGCGVADADAARVEPNPARVAREHALAVVVGGSARARHDPLIEAAFVAPLALELPPSAAQHRLLVRALARARGGAEDGAELCAVARGAHHPAPVRHFGAVERFVERAERAFCGALEIAERGVDRERQELARRVAVRAFAATAAARRAPARRALRLEVK
mmetsp:Transcript_12789/g.42206  ORF Transcript_12789/g.42206 Transcript_12789/m.42206 type:complete len:217 (+) Transcript_12789:474-1124(+)